jgi:hypothetical protein
MDYDGSNNNLDEFMRSSPELIVFLQEIAEQGADRWATRSRWRTGFNATHVRAEVQKDDTGNLQGLVDAYGYYAKYREAGTRYNQPEHVLQDFMDQISDEKG